MHVENELKNLEELDAAYFRGKNYFDYLVFQEVYKYFDRTDSNPKNINSSMSKGQHNEKITSVTGFAYP